MSSVEPDPWMLDAFKVAEAEFNSQLKEGEKLDFSQYRSIEEVYNATDEIQKRQSKDGKLRHLSRIKPYLDNLKQYSDIVEQFIRLKPDLLTLIWGPLKLLLLLSSNLVEAFEHVVEVLAEIGHCLPQFHGYKQLFENNDKLQRLLCLFYQDILDAHVTLLKLFRKSKWELFFESLWPRTAGKLAIVQKRVSQHNTWMNAEVTLENITEEVLARRHTYERYEQQQDFEDLQNFRALLAEISPRLYGNELDIITTNRVSASAPWLEKDVDFKKWVNPRNMSRRCLWLQGIPGAGKTVTSGFAVRSLQREPGITLYVFLTYRDEEHSNPLKVFQSLIFQLLHENKALRPCVHEAYLSQYRQLTGDREFVKNLFCNLLQDSGQTYIIVDGLDEVQEMHRGYLLKSLLNMLKMCNNVKLLLSSRPERSISRELVRAATSLRVDQLNRGDIATYIQEEGDNVVASFQDLGAEDDVSVAIRSALDGIMEKAKGMFLYAKLMMDVVKALDNPQEIQQEVENLPEGLDQAYDRILIRIKDLPVAKERAAARKILEWVACATHPLRQEEVLQALAIEAGSSTFTKGRKAFRDLLQTCGPVIEVVGQYVHFVHFTAKEYLFEPEGRGRYLQVVDANLELASTCLTYLSFESLDTICSAELNHEVEPLVVSGDFVLLEYAAQEWLTHVCSFCSKAGRSEAATTLARYLEKFFMKRQKESPDTVSASFPKVDFRVLRRYPEFRHKLSHSTWFRDALTSGALEQEDENWVESDPSYISTALVRVRTELENLVCDTLRHKANCRCPELKKLYGENLFRCTHTSCVYFHTGFSTRSARSDHLRIHNRPYKCSHLECMFAELGFRSANHLSRHESKTHLQHSYIPMTISSNIGTSHRTEQNIYAVLVDAIEQDQVEVIKDILSRASQHDAQESLSIAAKRGSGAVMDCCLTVFKEEFRRGKDRMERSKWNELLEATLHTAIMAENAAAVECVLTQNFDLDFETDLNADMLFSDETNSEPDGAIQPILDRLTPFEYAFGQASPDVMGILLRNGAYPSIRTEHLGQIFAKAGQRRLLTKDDEDSITRLQKLRKFHLSKHVYQFGLLAAIQSPSLQYARFCLEMGANPNAKARRPKQRKPPIWFAVKAGNAEMVKLLLQHGADPRDARDCSDLPGVEKIEEHFGVSWDEIVSEYGVYDGDGDSHLS